MATYIALIHDPVGVWDDPGTRTTGMQDHARFGETHGARLVGGAELAPDAVTLRPTPDGGVIVTDGAHPEAKEVLGGFYVVAAPDRDAAVEIARHVPVLAGCLVVRALVDHRGTGEQQWAVLIHDDEDAWADPDRAAAGHARHQEFWARWGDALRGGHQLASVTTATTVRAGDGGVAVTDGPFSETKEVLTGYYAFTADDLDAALAVARDVPTPGGTIELRPVVENAGRPAPVG